MELNWLEKSEIHLEKGSKADQVEQLLIQELKIGTFEPGERLDEAVLSKRFGFSRTPLREAITRLVVRGLLVKRRNRGVQIANSKVEELAQVFEAMQEIEIACARIASSRMTLHAKSKIEAAQAACVAAAMAGDVRRFLQANERFHLQIYAATNNPAIAQVASNFRDMTFVARARKYTSKTDLVAAAESHRILLKDLFAANTADASIAMRSHVQASYLCALRATAIEAEICNDG